NWSTPWPDLVPARCRSPRRPTYANTAGTHRVLAGVVGVRVAPGGEAASARRTSSREEPTACSDAPSAIRPGVPRSRAERGGGSSGPRRTVSRVTVHRLGADPRAVGRPPQGRGPVDVDDTSVRAADRAAASVGERVGGAGRPEIGVGVGDAPPLPPPSTRPSG